MNTWVPALAIVAAAVAISGCSSSDGDVIAPVTMEVDDLQNATVDLVVGDTGDVPVDSYAGEIADTSVAEFTPGRVEDDATFNPGVTGLSAGSTEVLMSNVDNGDEAITFTVVVGDG